MREITNKKIVNRSTLFYWIFIVGIFIILNIPLVVAFGIAIHYQMTIGYLFLSLLFAIIGMIIQFVFIVILIKSGSKIVYKMTIGREIAKKNKKLKLKNKLERSLEELKEILEN